LWNCYVCSLLSVKSTSQLLAADFSATITHTSVYIVSCPRLNAEAASADWVHQVARPFVSCLWHAFIQPSAAAKSLNLKHKEPYPQHAEDTIQWQSAQDDRPARKGQRMQGALLHDPTSI
jgi:hypothetical protein